MRKLEFNTIDDAKQYCDGIKDWEFGDGIKWDDVVTTIYNNDCTIPQALRLLGENPADYDCDRDDDEYLTIDIENLPVNIVNLYLRNMQMDDDDLRILINFITKNNTIKEIDLADDYNEYNGADFFNEFSAEIEKELTEICEKKNIVLNN